MVVTRSVCLKVTSFTSSGSGHANDCLRTESSGTNLGVVQSRLTVPEIGHTRLWAGENSQAVRGFLLVPPGEKAQIRGMTTTTRPGGLCGWSIWCASVAISLAFCASAFAGANSDVLPQKKVQSAQKSVRKLCFVHSSTSAIPQPCDRIFGPVPTTASPLEIIRR